MFGTFHESWSPALRNCNRIDRHPAELAFAQAGFKDPNLRWSRHALRHYSEEFGKSGRSKVRIQMFTSRPLFNEDHLIGFINALEEVEPFTSRLSAGRGLVLAASNDRAVKIVGV